MKCFTPSQHYKFLILIWTVLQINHVSASPNTTPSALSKRPRSPLKEEESPKKAKSDQGTDSDKGHESPPEGLEYASIYQEKSLAESPYIPQNGRNVPSSSASSLSKDDTERGEEEDMCISSCIKETTNIVSSPYTLDRKTTFINEGIGSSCQAQGKLPIETSQRVNPTTSTLPRVEEFSLNRTWAQPSAGGFTGLNKDKQDTNSIAGQESPPEKANDCASKSQTRGLTFFPQSSFQTSQSRENVSIPSRTPQPIDMKKSSISSQEIKHWRKPTGSGPSQPIEMKKNPSSSSHPPLPSRKYNAGEEEEAHLKTTTSITSSPLASGRGMTAINTKRFPSSSTQNSTSSVQGEIRRIISKEEQEGSRLWRKTLNTQAANRWHDRSGYIVNSFVVHYNKVKNDMGRFNKKIRDQTANIALVRLSLLYKENEEVKEKGIDIPFFFFSSWPDKDIKNLYENSLSSFKAFIRNHPGTGTNKYLKYDPSYLRDSYPRYGQTHAQCANEIKEAISCNEDERTRLGAARLEERVSCIEAFLEGKSGSFYSRYFHSEQAIIAYLTASSNELVRRLKESFSEEELSRIQPSRIILDIASRFDVCGDCGDTLFRETEARKRLVRSLNQSFQRLLLGDLSSLDLFVRASSVDRYTETLKDGTKFSLGKSRRLYHKYEEASEPEETFPYVIHAAREDLEETLGR